MSAMSAERVPHRLPPRLTSFVGRQTELDGLAEALRGGGLVTLVGPGGCGKTRLAAETAARQARTRPDGVWWVDLSDVADPAAVPGALGAALGVLVAPGRAAAPALARQLSDRRALICLDNCEHVLDAAAELVMELLRGCPDVVVLATGREPLGVPGEVVWRVPPLSGGDAVALFEERAGGAPASARARAAVRTACARLDGIPLAIELAAAWSGTLSAEEILRGLDDRFALLVRGPRGVPARHRTLAASMAWSHDLLAEDDRVLFRRLGALCGGFTLATARGVCAFEPLDGTAVRDGLRRLVDKSLLVADTRGDPARFRMLETVHRYAAALLEASGETERVRDRHLDTYLAFAEEAAPLLATDKDAWRAAVVPERDNLRAAVEHGLSLPDAGRGRRLAAELAWLWHLDGHGHEGMELLGRAIERGAGERTALQARLLTGLALVADTTRPLGLEYDAAEAALEISTGLGDEAGACLARLLLAVGRFAFDLDAGRALAEAARDQARRAGEAFVADAATALTGIIAHLRDDHAAAVPLLEASVAGLAARGERGIASTALAFLAAGVLYGGDPARARELAAEALRMARPLGGLHRVGLAGAVLATVEGTAGRLAEAHAVLEPMVRLLEGSDPPPFVPGLARAMGWLRLWEGRPGEAAGWFRSEADWRDGATLADLTPQALTGLAEALRATGDADAATEACERALAAARHAGMPRVLADALEQSALLADDAARAEDLHHQALALRADHGLWLCCVPGLEALAGLAARAGSFVEAARLLGACDRAREEMGYPRRSPWRGPADDLPALLREALGDDAHDAARAEGRALDLRDAVAYARRARGRRGRPSSGWDSLTPTERGVVRLAVEGLSNPEIGARLFMSRSTVKTHLSHVYAKLGVANRTELAALAGPLLTDT